MSQIIATFLLSVLAGVVANYISKWLVDRHERKHKR